jgi:hypothetical protein
MEQRLRGRSIERRPDGAFDFRQWSRRRSDDLRAGKVEPQHVIRTSTGLQPSEGAGLAQPNAVAESTSVEDEMVSCPSKREERAPERLDAEGASHRLAEDLSPDRQLARAVEGYLLGTPGAVA